MAKNLETKKHDPAPCPLLNYVHATISFELGLTLEKTFKEYSALRVYQQLDPEGIDLALKRDREIAAGHTNAIGKDEFLRRIRRN